MLACQVRRSEFNSHRPLIMYIIPCHNEEECPYKKWDKLKYGVEGWVCDKPPMPVLAPKYCLWRKLAEA